MKTLNAKKSRLHWSFWSLRLTALVALAVFGVATQGNQWVGPHEAQANTGKRHEDLLTVYTLLGASLSDESNLKWLLLMRKLTLNKTPTEVAKLMEEISATSKKRADELEKIRKLAPSVVGVPLPSPIGDAIQASAKDMGTHEMIFPDGNFNMRFLFLQAQATRMIAVIAKEGAKVETNATRKQWLDNLATEYEGLRNKLLASVKNCVPR